MSINPADMPTPETVPLPPGPHPSMMIETGEDETSMDIDIDLLAEAFGYNEKDDNRSTNVSNGSTNVSSGSTGVSNRYHTAEVSAIFKTSVQLFGPNRAADFVRNERKFMKRRMETITDMLTFYFSTASLEEERNKHGDNDWHDLHATLTVEFTEAKIKTEISDAADADALLKKFRSSSRRSKVCEHKWRRSSSEARTVIQCIKAIYELPECDRSKSSVILRPFAIIPRARSARTIVATPLKQKNNMKRPKRRRSGNLSNICRK